MGGHFHFVIYKSNHEYPTKFVVRELRIATGGRIFLARGILGSTDSLEEARALVPTNRQRVRIPRHKDDDLSVVETWI